MEVGVSRDTAFCIHSPQEIIPKDAWLSHYSMAGKECFNMWLFVTGAYHINGKNECIRKIAYYTDNQYMLLAHAEPVHPWLIPEARKTGADLVFCGKHVWMDVKKIARLTPPWFGPEWSTSFDYLKKKAEDAGLSVASLELDQWVKPESTDFCIDIQPQTPDTVDILLPCSWDFIPLRLWSSLATMQMNRVARILVSGCDDIVSARNALVDAHLKGQSGYSIFFDADMAFPQQVINQLLSHNKDIVGGAYYQRQYPYYPHIYEILGDMSFPRSKRVVAIHPFMKADAIGTGCLLVKRNVYEKLGDNPFRLVYVNGDNLVGEDIGFCILAKENGFEVNVDTTMDIAHVGNFAVNPEEARKFQAQWRPM